jgi:hypothetical protein
MSRLLNVIIVCVLAAPLSAQRAAPDSIPATGGAITVQPLTHATVQITQGSHVVLVDPTIREQDPKAFAAALKETGIEVRLRDWYPGAPPFTYDPKQPFGAAPSPPPPPPPPPG